MSQKVKVDPFITRKVPNEYQQLVKGGSLEGLTLAVKDIFEVKGHRSSFGNPTWLNTHGISKHTTPCVQVLYEAGCKIVGFVITDEMAFSLNGENHHYGTPLNAADEEKVPGGSSNGSASAVSMGLADTALGSDTGGSVRVPSHNQGIFGIRPSHNRISLEHVLPLALSHDTVGWFARDAAMLERVGNVLLKNDPKAVPQKQPVFNKMIIAKDLFDSCDSEVSSLIYDKIEQYKPNLEAMFGKPILQDVTKIEGVPSLEKWSDLWFEITGYENYQLHKDWFKSAAPVFGNLIDTNIKLGEFIKNGDYEKTVEIREKIYKHQTDLLGNDSFLIFPTSPVTPPKLNTDNETLKTINARQFSQTSLAVFGKNPQISLPAGYAASGPVGLSILGPRNSDEKLLSLAVEISKIMGLKQLKK